MKILMCNSFNYPRGGAERCFMELSSLLKENGHDVIPFCIHHERNEASAYSDYFVSQVDFPTLLQQRGIKPKLQAMERVIYSREAKTKIERLLADTQPDIVHIHGIAHEISPSILPAITKVGIPTIQTLHDYKLVCPSTSFVSNGRICEACKGGHYYNVVRNRCKRNSLSASMLAGVEMTVHKLLQIYERNIDTFISPSRFLQEKLKEHGVQNRIVNIPNFIDTERFSPSYEPENYFVYLGRLADTKGLHTLIKAMEAVPDAQLRIAGTGDLEDELKAYVAKNNMTNVDFLGFVSGDALQQLIERALAAVVPSEWYENYSMTVLESFAVGTPVIGANIGGIPEQVRPNETGLLFEPGNIEELSDCIRTVWQNRDKAIAMGEGARKQAERVNAPLSHYNETMQLYTELVEAKKKRLNQPALSY